MKSPFHLTNHEYVNQLSSLVFFFFLIPHYNRKNTWKISQVFKARHKWTHSTVKALPLLRPTPSSITTCTAFPEKVPHIPASRCLFLLPWLPALLQPTFQCPAQMRLLKGAFPSSNNFSCSHTFLHLSPQLSMPNLRVLMESWSSTKILYWYLALFICLRAHLHLVWKVLETMLTLSLGRWLTKFC